LKKIIWTGIIWSIIYFSVVGKVLEAFFGGFTPFYMAKSGEPATLESIFQWWIFLIYVFLDGRWSIQKLMDWLLLISFVAFYPVWAYGWWRLCKVSWTRLWKKIHEMIYGLQPAKEITKVPKLKKKKGLQRPAPLSAQTFAVSPVQQAGTSEEKRNTSQTQETFSDSSSDSYESMGTTTGYTTQNDSSAGRGGSSGSGGMPVLNTPQMTPALAFDKIREIGSSFGFDVLEDISIAGSIIPMVLATPTRAFLIRLFDTPDKEWIADEMGDDPVWFYASGQEVSPFYELKKIADAFAKEEPDSEIKPLLVVINGSIINGEDMIPDWEMGGGMVVRINDLTNNGMLTLEEYLKQEDEKKSGEVPLSDDFKEGV